ncbi:hypothetical protein [Bifidobacterium aquikefiricola]|uniref:Type II secretion system F family protein n=1 Tax=Bifidobacterium aquikefiricola TaxID=3059038 RepID=A0AB39U7K7_9BIFI
MNMPACAGLLGGVLVLLLLRTRRHGEFHSEESELHVSLSFVLEMITVCVRLGASIPRALELVGEALEGEFGEGLQRVAQQLQDGTTWHEAWSQEVLSQRGSRGGLNGGGLNGGGLNRERLREQGSYMNQATGIGSSRRRGNTRSTHGSLTVGRQRCAHYHARLAEALEPSWRHGVSPILRIEAVIEQLDRDDKRGIEDAGARLAVRILLPVGLCFLPSFIMIGVIPCLAAFASDLF